MISKKDTEALEEMLLKLKEYSEKASKVEEFNEILVRIFVKEGEALYKSANRLSNLYSKYRHKIWKEDYYDVEKGIVLNFVKGCLESGCPLDSKGFMGLYKRYGLFLMGELDEYCRKKLGMETPRKGCGVDGFWEYCDVFDKYFEKLKPAMETFVKEYGKFYKVRGKKEDAIRKKMMDVYGELEEYNTAFFAFKI